MASGSVLGRVRIMLALAVLATIGAMGEASAAAEGCPLGASRELLCNVEPELRRSYLWIERVEDLAFTRERIASVVRERRVTIEWDWSDFDRGHLGSFRAAGSQVLLPAHVRGQPDRVEAAILAHELWHAHASFQHLYPASMQGCLDDERAAFMVGVAYYNRFLRQSSDRAARSEVDARMLALDQQWRERGGTQTALEALADDHLARNGYAQDCARYPAR